MGAKDVLRWLFFVFIILPLLVFIIIPLFAILLFLLPSLFFMGEMWFLSEFVWPLNLPLSSISSFFYPLLWRQASSS
jgi:hypothetical protein